MSKKKPVENPEDLVRALDELFNQAMMDIPEEADDILREAGYDPDQLGREMAEFARQVSAKSPLDWRNKREELEQAKSQLPTASQHYQMTRSQKEARLRELFSEQERLGMVVGFRKFTGMSDQDLDSLLADTEFLIAQQQEKGDDEGDGKQ